MAIATKLTVLLAVLVLATLGLAACGGDDEDSGDTVASTETTAEDTGATEASGGTGGTAEAVEISADPDGALAYTTDEIDAAVGTAEITFDNPSSTPHDVRVESPDGSDLGGTEAISESTATASVDLAEPGAYTYYCSVDGHRAAGMEGTLNVK